MSEAPETASASSEADQLRDQGNAKFKAKEYKEAIEFYSRSLELNPACHKCYSNRSAAQVALKTDLEKALADAQKCVELMPSWGKGYLRICESLVALKRGPEAKPWLEKALETEGLDDRDKIEAKLKEVPKWQFQQVLRGTWHGTVNEVLGGYDQEMEFLDNDAEVRIDVLGRSIVGKFWVDVSSDPHHLNIQVPHMEVPPGMPPPPPVPYIARIDSIGLHLCCPYLKMERPKEFTGPGYVLMKSGGIPKPDDSEVANLSKKDKLLRCAQELLKAMPSRKMEEPTQTDSEDAAGEKLMQQVRFESSMFSIQKQFGEEVVKEVICCAKSGGVPEIEGTQEIKQLGEKMKIAGLLEDEEDAAKATAANSSAASQEAAATSSATAPPPKPAEPPSQRGAEAPVSKPSADNQSCATMATGVLFSAAAVAALGFMFYRRSRSQ